MSERESDMLTDESLAYDEELQRNGRLIFAHALRPAHTATIVRARNGKLSATDGPFAKEQLGGFILIDARDLNEVIQVAAKIPLACLGTIEVRPIQELT
jgi:hypothetical protein